MILKDDIEQLIERAINEDIRSGDITSEVLVPEDCMTSGQFILKQAGVLAGLPFIELLFKKIDPTIKIELLVKEGSQHNAGTAIATITGPARSILSGERIALNILQHASGVATMTSHYVKKLKGLPCSILDTRKTLPGLRALEKYAVKVGGGMNHRFGLDDRFIIKNNHFCFLKSSKTAIKDAVKMVKARKKELEVEVEITQITQLPEVLQTEAEAIMLSRMTPAEIKKCVAAIRKTNKKVYVESLGTITLDTVRAYAETGVDGISIGSVTHSVPALDIVMRIK